jgi:chorismate synthase
MLRFLTAGESHGPTLTGILEGMPAGLPLSSQLLDSELARRQHGFGSGGRMKLERDHARISAGVQAGLTTGAPIALHIENLDHAKWRDRDIEPMTIPRPGHADLTGAVKYGYRELRLSLERASARETAMRVAVGAVCRALLRALGIELGGYVVRIGELAVPPAATPPSPEEYRARFAAAEASAVRCADPAAAAQMQARIAEIIRCRDTLGGVVECVALGVPPGLGSHTHWDRRLPSRLGQAVLSIHAVKGVELGDGFAGCTRPGTQAQDEYVLDGEAITQPTNRAGGIEGGISTGGPIVVRAAFKPIATTLTPLRSVDLARGAAAPTKYERSDFCQVPRAVPIVEAMVALVLADALLEKLGGDSLGELQERLGRLRRLRLSDLPMDGVPWRFGYE